MVQVVGIEKVNYVSKKTGNPVNGVKIHFVEDINPEYGEGVRGDSIFVKPEMAVGLEVHSCIDIIYNKYGSVTEIRVIE